MQGMVVLISGRGSNLKAICDAGLKEHIKCVISNKADAKGLEYATTNGIPTKVISHTHYKTREEFDKQLAACIDTYTPQLIVLAGFFRILTSWFVNKYANTLINIHPSILPAFIGANAQADALSSNVKVSGATVHFVTEQLDHGPIIMQGVVPVEANDTEDNLSNRILSLEHIMYPFAIRKILTKQVTLMANGFVAVNKDATDSNILSKYASSIFY